MYGLIPTIIFALTPEVLYFTLFLIFTKGYKNKRLSLFLALWIGYIIFKFVLKANIYFHICYTLYVTIVLKFLYISKFHISDIFVFSYASILLMLISCLQIPIYLIFNQYILAFILNRISMFIFLFLMRKSLNKYYKWIISQWNRNYDKPNKIKSITLRQICVISLNVMIYILNLWIVYINNLIGS